MPPTRCPVCGNTFDSDQSPAMPFCSKRCRQIDLGRWLDEKYGLPHVPEEGTDEEAEPSDRADSDRGTNDADDE